MYTICNLFWILCMDGLMIFYWPKIVANKLKIIKYHCSNKKYNFIIVFQFCLICICCTLCVFVVLLCICCTICVFVVPYVYLLYYVCIAVLTLDAGLLARSQYPEGPATGHLGTGFCLFPSVYKRRLRWFPSFQVATTCLSCSSPDLNFLVTFFHICVHVK